MYSCRKWNRSSSVQMWQERRNVSALGISRVAESRESYQGLPTGTVAWITSITTSHVSTKCDYFSLETNPDSLFGGETNKKPTTTRSHALRSINIAWSHRRVFQRNYRRCQTMTSLLRQKNRQRAVGELFKLEPSVTQRHWKRSDLPFLWCDLYEVNIYFLPVSPEPNLLLWCVM